MHPILEVNSLETGYGNKQVLNGVNIFVSTGEIVALIGHNGAGKSTLLKAIFGLVPIWSGRVCFNGEALNSVKQRDLLRDGMAYVPQGNQVFSDLTVRENMEIGGMTLHSKRRLDDGIERALAAFPVLRKRLRHRAGVLSGGEKQMLSLANALVLSPRLLLLDEPSLGLAPTMIKEALAIIQRLSSEHGVAILIVEQKVREVLEICHRVYCLRLGMVTCAALSTDLKTDREKLRRVFL